MSARCTSGCGTAKSGTHLNIFSGRLHSFLTVKRDFANQNFGKCQQRIYLKIKQEGSPQTRDI